MNLEGLIELAARHLRRRYLALAESPSDAKVLGPLISQEIHYRLLVAPFGGMLRRLIRHDSNASAIARAIGHIRGDIRSSIAIPDLARRVGMSASSFHKHFKTIASTTPLQHQKELRLLEARRLLKTGGASVTTGSVVCFFVDAVGYEAFMAPHWTFRLALALLLLIGLAGCPDDDPFEGCAAPIPPDFGPANPGIARAGKPVRVFARPIRFQVCSNASSDPSSAIAEVTGPEGELLEAQVEIGTFSTNTAVQFTPVQPGPHHVLLEFMPQGGIHQLDVHAAMDRSAETPSQFLSQTCASLERTLQGAWVCDSSVVRGTETLDSFTGARLAVAGDVIWVVDGSSVRRYVDRGTELLLTGTTSRAFGGVDFLLASPNELVVLQSTSLTLYTFQGSGVTAGPSTSWIRPSVTIAPDSPYGVLLREGNQLAIATRLSSGNDFVVQVCPYQLLLDRFERTTGECRRLPGEIIGFEPDALWTRELPESSSTGQRNPLQIRRWIWAGGQLTEQGSMSLGVHVFVPSSARFRTSVVPLVHNSPFIPGGPSNPSTEIPRHFSLVTWSPQRKALFLEHLDEEITSGYASPGFYWGFASPSGPQPTKVRLRLPTP